MGDLQPVGTHTDKLYRIAGFITQGSRKTGCVIRGKMTDLKPPVFLIRSGRLGQNRFLRRFGGFCHAGLLRRFNQTQKGLEAVRELLGRLCTLTQGQTKELAEQAADAVDALLRG